MKSPRIVDYTCLDLILQEQKLLVFKVIFCEFKYSLPVFFVYLLHNALYFSAFLHKPLIFIPVFAGLKSRKHLPCVIIYYIIYVMRFSHI